MENSFSNGNNRFGKLSDYLSQTRQTISRVQRVAGQTIRKNERDLYQIHADNESKSLMMLLQEINIATGVIDQNDIIEENQRNVSSRQNSANNSSQPLFRFSQKQIWSNFAREITKSLKRNM
jgi:hypothetical protein